MAGGEEVFDLVHDVGGAFGFEDFAAEGAAAGDAVGEPGGELLHAADGVALGGFVIACASLMAAASSCSVV